MATIVPASELTKKALAWIENHRREQPDASLNRLIDEACSRFNLGPLDAESLARVLRQEEAQGE